VTVFSSDLGQHWAGDGPRVLVERTHAQVLHVGAEPGEEQFDRHRVIDEQERCSAIAAADAVIATGIAGTAYEAWQVGVPVIAWDVVPGHGERSARAAQADGLAAWARSDDELVQWLQPDGLARLQRNVRRAATLFEQPFLWELVVELLESDGQQNTHESRRNG
jgi:hypothetical protein